jgi:hypothetical protein
MGVLMGTSSRYRAAARESLKDSGYGSARSQETSLIQVAIAYFLNVSYSPASALRSLKKSKAIALDLSLFGAHDLYKVRIDVQRLTVISIAVNELVEDATVFSLESSDLCLHLSDFANDGVEVLLVHVQSLLMQFSNVSQALDRKF